MQGSVEQEKYEDEEAGRQKQSTQRAPPKKDRESGKGGEERRKVEQTNPGL